MAACLGGSLGEVAGAAVVVAVAADNLGAGHVVLPEALPAVHVVALPGGLEALAAVLALPGLALEAPATLAALLGLPGHLALEASALAAVLALPGCLACLWTLGVPELAAVLALPAYLVAAPENLGALGALPALAAVGGS